MKKWIAYFFVVFAFAMLTLHAVVPHHHHEQLSFQEHVAEHDAAESITDFLALLFHFEGGDQVLDSVLSTSASFSLVLWAFVTSTGFIYLFTPILVLQEKNWIEQLTVPTNLIYLTSGKGLRAPPII